MMIGFMRKNARWIAGLIVIGFLLSSAIVLLPFLGG